MLRFFQRAISRYLLALSSRWNETGLKIRPATPADILPMFHLEKHAVTAAHWTRQQYERMFSEPDPRRLALIIEAESTAQGFLIARDVANEWELENIAIAGPARRRGMGTRLLGEFLDQVKAEGAEAVFLEARESNRAARALYEKWAFVESGRRRRYYRDPEEDAVVYRLSL
ncbi:MAG: ribosomal-protein-alanine N-acetyltransferase [Acidobacteria bacterium]|nr:MAG: ribosomal-protein-alanine N-acetyltransferase [Acidobacteriota bacterium]